MEDLILGIIPLLHDFCFFKPFLMVDQGLKVGQVVVAPHQPYLIVPTSTYMYMYVHHC